MRKILFVCNTYYQLIAAMQLNVSLFKNDRVSVVLSDQSKDAEAVVGRLRKLDFFDCVFYMQTKEYDGGKHSVFSAIVETVFAAFGYSKIAEEIGRYDELVYFNPTCSTLSIFSKISRENRKKSVGSEDYQAQNILCSRVEEGIFSYTSDFLEGERFALSKRVKIALRIRKLFQKSNYDNLTKNFYCFFPEIYKGNLNPVSIPLIDTEGIVPHMLSKAFNIDKNKLSYHQKYIFFSSVYDFEGGNPIGESRLIESVAELVGRENILIKQHPRDRRSIFKDMGLQVDENSAVPWEALQLTMDFSDKVFLTTTSGSVLSANLITEGSSNTYFLYDVCDLDGKQLCDLSRNAVAARSVKALKGLMYEMKDTATLKKVKIAKSIDEIL